MAIAVNGYDGNAPNQNSIIPNGRFLEEICRLTLSGNYPTNGDTLDLTNGGVNSAVPSAQSQNKPIIEVFSNGPAASIGANGGNFQFVPGSTLANGKLKIFATAGTEYANGAYGTDATTDVIYARILWPR